MGSADPSDDAVFVFFSNRVGCLGSLAISVAVTIVLLGLVAMLRHG